MNGPGGRCGESTLGGKRVLLVDDSRTMLLVLQGLLAGEGAFVDTASTGTQGLAKLSVKPGFDVVLLDLVLPDLSGLEVLEALRARDNRTTVLVLTGAGDVKSTLAAMRAGADGYTEKKEVLAGGDSEMLLCAIEQAMQYRAYFVEKEEMQEKLRYISFHDSLTDLHNRAFFDFELTRLEREGNYPVALFVVDVNWLKYANDNFGHLAGDDLIRRAAEALRSVFSWRGVVARTGGDEFVAIVADAKDEDIARYMEGIREAERRMNGPAYQAPLSMGVGFAVARDAASLRAALREADEAMYRDKERIKAGRKSPLE